MKASLIAKFRLAFAGLALAPLIAIGILVIQKSHDFRLEQAVMRQEDICYAASLKVDRFFHSVEEHLHIFLDVVNLENLDRSQRDVALASLLFHKGEEHRSLFTELALMDPRGEVLGCASVQGDCLHAEGLRQRIDFDHVIKALGSGRGYKGPVFFDPISGRPRMIVALPVVDIRSGGLWAVLCGEVRLKGIWQMVDWKPKDVAVRIYILDQEGRIIAHPDPSVVLSGTRFAPALHAGVAMGLSGDDAVIVSQPVVFGGQIFRVVTERPIQDVLTATKYLAWQVLGIVLLAIVLVVLMGVWTHRQIVRPVVWLREKAQRMGEGDLGQRINLDRGDELGDLAASLNAMARDLEKKIAALKEENRERMLKELALMEEKGFSDALIASMPGVFYHFDHEGRFLHWNRDFERGTGYSGEEIAGMLPTDVIAPEDRETVSASIGKVFQEGDATVEAMLLTKGGRRIPYYFTGKMFAWEDRRELIGVGMDISDRKAAETALQDYAHRLERINAELEQFAFISSHHLQEPIRKIINFGDLLTRELGADLNPNAQRYLRYLTEGAHRMRQLIEDLMALMELDREPPQPETVEVEGVIGQVLRELGDGVADSGAMVTWDPMPAIETDRGRLRLLLRNLIGNAVTFRGPEAPRVHISARTAQEPSGSAVSASEAKRGVLEFRVTDNGMGIDPAYHERIFGVFERLHPVGKYPGTGMGLALCKKIVEQTGGKIWVESSAGKGACFCFTLPETPKEKLER